MTIRTIEGDCLEAMRALPDASVDACVTDPPYDLSSGNGCGFMGKAWDGTGIAFRPDTWAAVHCVLKPGARLLAFGGTRTYHRMTCAIEDVGFVIEDSIHWLHGQGFPKHKSKLKPAHEPIVLATKPGGSKWLGVDACRVGIDSGDDIYSKNPHTNGTIRANGIYGQGNPTLYKVPPGRWPTNIVFTHHPDCVPCGERRVKGSTGGTERNEKSFGLINDDSWRPGGTIRQGYADADGLESVAAWTCHESCPVAELDRQSGERKSGKLLPHHADNGKSAGCLGAFSGATGRESYGDTGTASRFFPTFSWTKADFFPFLYCPKASRRERGDGNRHPTVKPIKLCEWLVRLSCPPGGTVLDPFMGSGTTGVACVRGGFSFIGIEQEAEYFAISQARIAHEEHQQRQQTPLLPVLGSLLPQPESP